jgi:hypothetical protein
MRKGLIVALLVASCGPPVIPITEKTTVPTNMQDDKTTGVTGDKKKQAAALDGWRAGPAGFPVPQDADAGTQVAGGDSTFNIPRKVDVVYGELKKHLASIGYAVDSDQKYMGGHRMMIKNRDGKQFAVTVASGEGDKGTVMTVSAK